MHSSQKGINQCEESVWLTTSIDSPLAKDAEYIWMLAGCQSIQVSKRTSAPAANLLAFRAAAAAALRSCTALGIFTATLGGSRLGGGKGMTTTCTNAKCHAQGSS